MTVVPSGSHSMLSTLPLDILELIVDDLHDEPATLKACCLVSKSSIPRTRKHLFARIEIYDSAAESWMKAFPDPSNSPTHYTRSLAIFKPSTVPAAFLDVGGWIRAFDKVVSLHVEMFQGDDSRHLVSLHGLPPATKSLFLACTSVASPELLSFVCSFPLEDLALIPYDLGSVSGGRNVPLASPNSPDPSTSGGLGVCWIAMALETVRSKNLQQVIIHPNSSTFVDEIWGMIYQEWLDLDRTLAQLCTSLSIRLQVMCEWVREGDDYDISYLSLRSLPEVTRRGLIDLIPTGA